ncbi:MAG: pantoate--beta-alanine ligase [Actinomycetota bacterium]
MRTVGTFAEARELASGSVGLVPTMGFLHEGHLSLIEAARESNDSVVVSLFVNPLQFNESSDLAAYPRDLDRDAALVRAAGADILFAPDAATMYPSTPLTSIEVTEVADAMEGAHRPGHFAGVATVVAKLFAGLQPDSAYFGRKDAQQLAVVATMAEDLSFPVEIVGLPIVREADGLALSSRNVRIEEHLRSPALSLSRSLFAAADAFDAGERSVASLRDRVRRGIADESDAEAEYVEMATAAGASITDTITDTVFLAVAVQIGDVRLIDNIHLDPRTGIADRGVRLETSSILYGGH